MNQAQIDQVLSALRQRTVPCRLEDVARGCPDLTEDEVIQTIGYLARNRELRLTLDVQNKYWVTVQAVEADSHESES